MSTNAQRANQGCVVVGCNRKYSSKFRNSRTCKKNFKKVFKCKFKEGIICNSHYMAWHDMNRQDKPTHVSTFPLLSEQSY